MARPDKRQQIMKAAEKLFTSRRFHEIVMSDIAKAAKVGKGTIYQYFQNKEDLFFQVATSGFDELCRLLSRKVCEDDPFADQLEDSCRQITDFFQSRRQLFRMMHSEDVRLTWAGGDLRQKWFQQRQNLIATVTRIIQKGVQEGVLRSDVSAETQAALLLGMLRTRAREMALSDSDELSDVLLIDLFLHGVGRADEADTPTDSPPAETAAGP